jgi:hypothetical protein
MRADGVSQSLTTSAAEHLAVLRACLTRISKIIVIGWRAREQHFLRLLGESSRVETRLLMVAGTLHAAHEVSCYMKQAGVKGSFDLFDGGFSQLVTARTLSEFLKA